MEKGQVISGEFGKILIRQKSNVNLELGELLIIENNDQKMLMQVFDLLYGSQISKVNLELISGINLEEDNDLEMLDANIRNYNLAYLKNLLTMENHQIKSCKTLPSFFSKAREISVDDSFFFPRTNDPLKLGKLRSGSKTIDIDIQLDGKNVLTEHILIPASTGKGKSNMISCMLWDMVPKDFCGILVIDPHDEYYGRHGLGLKDHPTNGNISYYTTSKVPNGANTLKINLKDIKPKHFSGALYWTDAQLEALNGYYNKYKNDWIISILKEKDLDHFQTATINVLKRRLLSLLQIKETDEKLSFKGAFSDTMGESTITNICNELEKGKIVIVDTSNFSGPVEILIGSIISTEILDRYKNYKVNGQLIDKPIISIVLEEAPRVIGKEVLEKGPNIFSTIAREGRKFKVGLIAITQLPSLIPRPILANMNTKIILGLEMAPERQSVIESSSQDLSNDSRSIASLDKGEAIITSTFCKFAIPIKIPYFPDVVKETQNRVNKEKYIKKDYSGINLEG